MRRTKWYQNYPIWTLFWVIETKTLIHGFVSITQNMSKLDNFGVILFVSFSYKNCCMFILWNLKNWCKNWFFLKKVCVLQRRACNKFKRNYLENYNDSEHAVITKNAPFSWSFRIYHFSYGCNWLDFPLSLCLGFVPLF